MASFIWLSAKKQMKYFNTLPYLPYFDGIRRILSSTKVCIAKGNIIEGIEAKE